MAGNKNSGRQTRLEELTGVRLASEAITEYYGSIKDGLIKILSEGEPSLVKFVFEHAIGKPTDKLNVTGDLQISPIQIIKLPDNGRSDSTNEVQG